MLNSKTLFAISGLFLLALFTFSLGMVTYYKKLGPWEMITGAKDIVRSVMDTGKVLPDRSYYLRHDFAPDQRYTLANEAEIADGYWAITRMDVEKGFFVVELVDTSGEIVHSWDAKYSTLVPATQVVTFLHGVRVLKDGNIVVAFDSGTGLGRLDSCGNTVWKRTDATYHHVVQDDPAGLWTWAAQTHANGDEQRLVLVDRDTGADIEEISLIDDVIGGSIPDALVVSIPEGYDFVRDTWSWGMEDLFHPNDVEPLPAEYADAFPQFSPGDLLVSLRNIDMVAVLDRESGKIKWSQTGPWRDQHDPDWQADGTITVYNNNTDRGLSNILVVDPATNETRALFAGNSPAYFSDVMGQHQLLPNGNWLILSPTEGRALEVGPGGNLVREVGNVINDKFNAIMPNVEFLPADYFDEVPSCSGG